MKKMLKHAEAGVVLLIAIFVLMLVSVMAIALIVSSGTETALSSNYNSSATVYYAALAGLEEARGRLQPKNPDFFNSMKPGFFPTGATPLTLDQVRYITNSSAGEVVDPRDSGGPYFDAEYAREFGRAITAVPDVTLIPSVSGNNAAGLPGPMFKWVRITAVTEKSLNLNVDNRTTPLDSNTLLYYDPAHRDGMGHVSPSLVVTATPPSTAVQALEITCFAVLPNGSQKLLQYMVARVPITIPPITAAVTLDGNSVIYIGPTLSTTLFKISGVDQFSPNAGCTPSPNPVYAIGYSNPADSFKLTGDLAVVNQPGNYVGSSTRPPNPSPPAPAPNFVATPNVAYVGSLIPSNFESDAGALNRLLESLRSNADAVVTPKHPTLASDLPTTMLPTNPMTIYVDDDLDLSGWKGTGYGLLVVTGVLKFDPGASWYGIVLLVGQGILRFQQGGGGIGGQVRGAVFVAKTVNDITGMPALPPEPLGASDMDFVPSANSSGGVFYSSCWVQAALTTDSYKKLSFREVPQ